MTFKEKLLATLLAGSMLTIAGESEATPRHKHLDSSLKQETTIIPRGNAKLKSPIKDRVQAILSDVKDDKGRYNILNSQTMRKLETTYTDGGGTLIFSDSPEYVKESGILYKDVVSGKARVLYYHLNDSPRPKKVAVILEALGHSTIVTVTRGGTSTPSSDYLKVGKATQLAYFNSEKLNETIFVAKDSPRFLQDDMDKTVLESGELVYGVYDFETNEPVKVTVLMYEAERNPFKFLKYARVLPRDEVALRGTFKGMNRLITTKHAYRPERDGIVYFPIGDNLHDEYIWGVDATDGTKILNYGNYGILYEIAIPTTGRYGTSYYLSPLGGVYSGVMRAIMSGETMLWETPADRAFFGDRTPPESEVIAKARNEGLMLLTSSTELAYLGSYQGHQGVRFEYSPPGASNLPVNIILMPAQ